MTYATLPIFAHFLAISGIVEAAPYPLRSGPIAQIGHDNVIAGCVPEISQQKSDMSIAHERFWLARVLSCAGVLCIIVVALALAIAHDQPDYGADPPRDEEHELRSSGPPVLGPSRALSTALNSHFQRLPSPISTSFTLVNNHDFTASPTHSRSNTIDDQTLTAHPQLIKRRRTRAEYCDGGQAEPALRTRHDPERRAETAPNFIMRSASRKLTLLRSLMGRGSMQPVRRVDIRILGVGLSWDHDESKALPGPKHDIRWLETFFRNCQGVQFSFLLDGAVTHEGIRRWLEETYETSTAESYLVLYFTGHGAEDDSLELYDSGTINAILLNKWISELRQKTCKHIPVYIVFDFCRTSPVEPTTKLAEDIHIVWACSPFQSAYDLDLSSDLPRSCFLMALALAVHDASTGPSLPAWKPLATRLRELVNVVQGGLYWGSKDTLPWRVCRCRVCLGGDTCPDAINSKEHQIVSLSTLETNLDFSALARFVASRFPLHIQRVVHRVSNDRWVMYFNPARIPTNRGSLQPRRPEFLRNNVCVSTQVIVRHMTLPTGPSPV